MIWFNSDKTKKINLDTVESYIFNEKASSYKEMNPEIKLYFNGRCDILYGEEAKQVWGILKDKK